MKTPKFARIRPHKETEFVELPSLLTQRDDFKDGLCTYPSVGVMTELIEGLGHEVGTIDQLVVPRPNSLKTQDLGVRYSPESACLPFKLLLGSLMESLDQGADMIGMVTERGPCRLGMYSIGMRMVLSELGHDAAFFDFNNSNIQEGYVKRFREIFQKTYGKSVSLHRLGRGFLIGCARMYTIEQLEMTRNRLMPLEKKMGSVMKCFRQAKEDIRSQRGLLGVWRAAHRGQQRLKRVPVNAQRNTVKVLLSGEAYCTMDPFANCDIEVRLARLGAEPVRVLWQTNYLLYPLQLDRFLKYSKRKAMRASAPYLSEQLGGDVNSNIGYALMAARMGLDGMIHLKPFGCMMEFVSENLLKVVSRDKDLPIMSLSLDDMRGEERLAVRLEAFVDNLFKRKAMKEGR